MGGGRRPASIYVRADSAIVAHYLCEGCGRPFFAVSTAPEPFDGHKIACPGCYEKNCPDDCEHCARQTMKQLDTLVNGPEESSTWRIYTPSRRPRLPLPPEAA